MQERFQLHAPAMPLLRNLLENSRSCSGGSGPVLAIFESLLAAGLRVPIILTDKYPNTEALSDTPRSTRKASLSA
jgi:hypothetical protein